MVVPYAMLPSITPFKEFRLWIMSVQTPFCQRGPGSLLRVVVDGPETSHVRVQGLGFWVFRV